MHSGLNPFPSLRGYGSQYVAILIKLIVLKLLSNEHYVFTLRRGTVYDDLKREGLM